LDCRPECDSFRKKVVRFAGRTGSEVASEASRSDASELVRTHNLVEGSAGGGTGKEAYSCHDGKRFDSIN
jgi:hypothetical protein